ncbi:HSF-type DNA-binding-domain-containing protein [Favolaschia claudopus]|uniref:HSF-type DNA-binding-domain-containing protein n=1 Tax=Favolaschia claudopus TaxID=2862362 RepID=A0AAV9ZNH2_9AGAR
MINDTESSHLISWTDPGTSFIIRNPGEFCRTVLGNHFTHNNVRAFNIWEFSHNKFLRGRPDLLGEVKGKSHEPDAPMKQVAAQLASLREENQRICEQLSTERQRIDRLVLVVNHLWDAVEKGFGPGSGS